MYLCEFASALDNSAFYEKCPQLAEEGTRIDGLRLRTRV